MTHASLPVLHRAFFLSVMAFAVGLGLPSEVLGQGPKLGAPKDGTPKPGIFLNGPMRWGRLVDIKSKTGAILNSNGTVNEFYLDTVISEAVGLGITAFPTTDDTKGKPREAIVTLALEIDPDSGHPSLRIAGTIKNPPGVNPATEDVLYNKSPKSAFQKAYKKITSGLGIIKVGGPTALPPYSQVPRNAAIVMEFDRPVNPKTIGPESIQFFVGVATAYNQLPPAPFLGRYIFKPETPRLVVFQPSISDVDDNRIELELLKYQSNPSKFPKMNPQVLPLNAVGFPASQSSASFNVAVFMPAEYKFSTGTTRILLGRDGTALNTTKSVTKYAFDPTNPGSSAENGVIGVVRVFRAGNSSDANSGFLADKTIPQILGTQSISVDSVDPQDSKILTVTFLNAACDLGIRIGDSIRQGSIRAVVAEVIDNSLAPTYSIRVEYLDPSLPPFNTTETALLTTVFSSSLSTKAGCFLLVAPQPTVVTNPLSGVDPQSTFTVRFSKPMNVANLNPFENFVLLANANLANPSLASVFEVIVSNVIPSPDLKQFRLVPLLPLPHLTGGTETLKLVVEAGSSGLTDLAGNPLGFGQFSFSPTFQLLASAPPNTSRNLNLRFDSLFEGPPGGPFVGPATLVSGQVTQPSPGLVAGRPATHFSRAADSSNAFIKVMPPFTQAVQTPLAPLGSRLQTVYRHIDLNLSINSITDLDLDVEQLSWAPFGAPFSDFFKLIRIDLSHCFYFPDEIIDPNSLLPKYPASGLTEASFVGNIFEPADHPQVTVYNGSYTINPNSLFLATSGVQMLSWPKFTSTYTWRDSSYGSRKFGGPNGNGVNPEQFYFVLGINPPPAVGTPTHPYGVSAVPSLGLPLLMDFRVYPAADPNTKGLNGFQVALAVTSSSKPNFRVFSTGGLDTTQAKKTVIPDIAPDGTQPTGGYFPPGSTQGTPGTKTPPGGPEVYWGGVDFAVKVSRAYSHFYDLTTAVAGQPNVTIPQFNNSNQIVIPTVQPPNTSVEVNYRGASTVTGGALTNASCFDAYGEPYPNANTVPPAPTGVNCGTVSGLNPPQGSSINFTPNMPSLNGSRFIQMRFTFTSDIVNNVNSSISAFGFAYSNP